MNFLDGIYQLALEAGYDVTDPAVLSMISQYFSISGDTGEEQLDSWDAVFFGMAMPTTAQVYAAACRWDDRVEAYDTAVDALKTSVDAFTGDNFLTMADADKWVVVAAQLFLCGLLDEDLNVVDPDNW